MNSHAERLESIQAMLAAGHRCVDLDRHSLLLWGGVGGGLIAFTDWVINANTFPDNAARATALLCWLSFWLGGMSWLDHRLTRKARAVRKETLPFAQAQITRAWWMLLAIGTLATFAMSFFGGGAMIYALWTVLLGLGMFFFGLFSRTLIEWIGLATILLGIVSLASGLPLGTARWLAAATFAIGLPLSGWLAGRSQDRRLGQRLLHLTVWLAAVILPALLIAHLVPIATRPTPETATVKIPAGSIVPIYVDFDSPLVAILPSEGLAMHILQDTEVALTDGQPDGRYRFREDDWHSVSDGVLHMRIDRILPKLVDGHPQVRLHGKFDFKGEEQ